ncbi:MAG: DUF2236 domain-containing protein [Marinicaulis sp.]|nr:DUF2236 domain-containing protein [Marinicaulis sp.]
MRGRIDDAAHDFLYRGQAKPIDFAAPVGEPALIAPDSVSWRVFKNPVSLFIGGVTAVILEFAEPRVRSGVWDFSTFKVDPGKRLRRTGLAAMVTVYGAKFLAERMIEGVRRMHDQVEGETPDGVAYRANDVELLNWVQATATFGFVEAFHRYVYPLTDAERDRAFCESKPAATLYGAVSSPKSAPEQEMLFAAMAPKLEASPILFEFLKIMRTAPAFPQPIRLAQPTLVRAAVDLIPAPIREIVGLGPEFGLRPLEERIVRRAARRADRIILPSSPAVKACLRLGLAEDYLFNTPAKDQFAPGGGGV